MFNCVKIPKKIDNPITKLIRKMSTSDTSKSWKDEKVSEKDFEQFKEDYVNTQKTMDHKFLSLQAK